MAELRIFSRWYYRTRRPSSSRLQTFGESGDEAQVVLSVIKALIFKKDYVLTRSPTVPHLLPLWVEARTRKRRKLAKSFGWFLCRTQGCVLDNRGGGKWEGKLLIGAFRKGFFSAQVKSFHIPILLPFFVSCCCWKRICTMVDVHTIQEWVEAWGCDQRATQCALSEGLKRGLQNRRSYGPILFA